MARATQHIFTVTSVQVSFSERLEFIIHAVPLVKTSSQHMFLELLTPACVESARYVAA